MADTSQPMSSRRVNTALPGRRRADWRGALAVAALAASALAGSACATARADTVPAGPPLVMPPPPERVLAPVEEPELATSEPATGAPQTGAAAPPSRPAPRPAAEAPPPAAPPAAAEQPPPPEPAQTRELRAVPSVNAATAERAIRETLARASRDIGRVDYGRLSSAGRSQYDQSKRFGEQAEQALVERNYVFAATLADKAATLAAGLAR